MKICFVASSGGHWEEIAGLFSLTEGNEAIYITEAGGQAESLKLEPLYVYPQINRREKWFLVHFFRLWWEAGKLLKKEKPDVVISTGALMAVPFCIRMKMRGGKVVFIESFARTKNRSLSGRIVYPFADLFLVQWETLLKYYPKAKYIGCIF